MDCIIDTNVLVEYIVLESELHKRAEEGLEKIDSGFVPSVVMEELAHVLERLKIDKKTINEKLHEVLESYELVSLSESSIIEASQYIMNEDVSFKRFNDKLVLSLAKQMTLVVFTFDSELISECRANGVKLL